MDSLVFKSVSSWIVPKAPGSNDPRWWEAPADYSTNFLNGPLTPLLHHSIQSYFLVNETSVGWLKVLKIGSIREHKAT